MPFYLARYAATEGAGVHHRCLCPVARLSQSFWDRRVQREGFIQSCLLGAFGHRRIFCLVARVETKNLLGLRLCNTKFDSNSPFCHSDSWFFTHHSDGPFMPELVGISLGAAGLVVPVFQLLKKS